MIYIPLTKGYVAVVDDDQSALAAKRWHAKVSPSGLVHATRSRTPAERSTSPGPRAMYLHREVLGATVGEAEVDHINGDGLDCRRANLRIATKAQNAQNVGRRARNKSGFRGVSRIRRFKNGREVNLRKPWLAQIQANGAYRYLGLHPTPEAAAEAWNRAAAALHGEFCRPNEVRA